MVKKLDKKLYNYAGLGMVAYKKNRAYKEHRHFSTNRYIGLHYPWYYTHEILKTTWCAVLLTYSHL